MIAIEQPQNFSTPGYPHQYRSNLTCTWAITASPDYLVRLETGHVSNDTCCENLTVGLFLLLLSSILRSFNLSGRFCWLHEFYRNNIFTPCFNSCKFKSKNNQAFCFFYQKLIISRNCCFYCFNYLFSQIHHPNKHLLSLFFCRNYKILCNSTVKYHYLFLDIFAYARKTFIK